MAWLEFSYSIKIKSKLNTEDGRQAARKGKIGLETHFPTAEGQPHLLGGDSDPFLSAATPGWEKKMSLLLTVHHQFYFLFEI